MPPTSVSLTTAVSDGTVSLFTFFQEHYVRGLYLLLLFSRACRFSDVRIIEVGHEPFCRQDVGQVLLISEQVVVSQIRRDRLEPFLVLQEEEEARKVLLTTALRRLFLETILSCRFLSGAHF